MALKKQTKETKAAEVKAAAETKEEVKTAVKAAEDKVSEKVEGTIHFVGLALLMLLMVYVTFNDVTRIFG